MPPHLAGLYNKHKDLYREEVDGAIKICKQEVDGVLKNFGLALMGVHTKRMAALLVDVHAANESSSSFTLPCHLSSTEAAAADAPPQGKAKEASPTKAPEVHPLETGSPSKVQQDGAANVVMGSPARNDYSPNYVPTPRKSVRLGIGMISQAWSYFLLVQRMLSSLLQFQTVQWYLLLLLVEVLVVLRHHHAQVCCFPTFLSFC